MAADLPKGGTYSGTYSAFATVKATAIGKDRLLVAFDENGLSVTNGFTDHMTWHLRAYDSVGEARESLSRYFTFYNIKRPHSSLDARTPEYFYP